VLERTVTPMVGVLLLISPIHILQRSRRSPSNDVSNDHACYISYHRRRIRAETGHGE